jgi:hypothetical protein
MLSQNKQNTPKPYKQKDRNMPLAKENVNINALI